MMLCQDRVAIFIEEIIMHWFCEPTGLPQHASFYDVVQAEEQVLMAPAGPLEMVGDCKPNLGT